MRKLQLLSAHACSCNETEVATTVTIEQLAEHLSQVLDDVPPHHLNHSEDEESSSASEAEPEPEKTKKNEEKNSKNKKKPKKMEKSQKPEKKGGRSHHVQVRCHIPGCSPRVFDIKRHLQTHLKREEIHEDDIDSYAEIMRHGKQKTLVSSGNPSKRGRHQCAGGRNGAPCRSVPPFASAWTNICSTYTI